MPHPPAQHLFHPDQRAEYLDAMHQGLDHLVATLGRVGAPCRGTSPAQAEASVAAVDLDRPAPGLGEVLEELNRVYLDDAVWFHDPSYVAHLNCPVVIPALVAELFVSAVNSSLDTFDQSVGGTHVERRLVEWTARRIGFTQHGARPDGVFTSGGTQSNLQGLLLAREEAVARGAAPEQLRVLVSADGHMSVDRAARLLGLAEDAVVTVPVDDRRRMLLPALDGALVGCRDRGEVVMAVVATAGTTDFGAIDPLPGVAELCRRHGTWLHVDAAYGGGLLVSRRRRHLLDGIEQADSVTVDFHKTWFQPVSASALLVRDARTLRHVTHHADYLNPADAQEPNQVDKSLQTTRRFDALKLWVTLRAMGPDALGDHLDTVVDLAAGLHEELLTMPDLDVAAPPSLSTLVLRCRPPGVPAADVGTLNERVREALWSRGTAVVARTKVDGETWLKLTLLNPMARPEDLRAVVAQLREVARELAAAAAGPVGEVA